MQIQIKYKYNYCYLSIEADNVNIEESISEVLYAKKEDGKTDFSKRLGIDIANEHMDKIIQMASDLVYYREREYNSSELIELCIKKMPDDVRISLIKALSSEYLD